MTVRKVRLSISQCALCACMRYIANCAGSLCSIGHYCPAGTLEEKICPPGTENPAENKGSRSDCSLCTPGHYCPAGTGDTDGPSCPKGHFCPAGTESANQVLIHSLPDTGFSCF